MLMRLVFVFIVLAFCVGFAGYLYHNTEKRQIKQNVQDELSAITSLKVNQIIAWRKERIGDAEIIAKNNFIISGIDHFLNNPGTPGLKKDIQQWISALQDNYDYRAIFLVDTSGHIRLSTDGRKNTDTVGQQSMQWLEESLRTRRVIFTDIHNPQNVGFIHIELIAPLVLPTQNGARPIGAIFFLIDPERFLYPLIQSWPGLSETAETLLLRQEQDEIVFLNELRYKKDTALSLRIPLSKKPELAALLEMSGQGILETRDYRNVPVLANIRSIPATSWHLISKIDQEEIYASFQAQARLIAIVIAILIATAGISILFWWRKHMAESAQQRAEEELKRTIISRQYDYLSKYANDIILLVDQQGAIREANDRAVTAYGYTRDELYRLTIKDLRPRELQSDVAQQFEQIQQQKGLIFETTHMTKNGIAFPVEISARAIDAEGKLFFQAIIRDITERKEAENALVREKHKAEAIIAAIGDGISIQDRDFRILYQNQVHKNMLGSHIGEYCYTGYEQSESACEPCPVLESFKDGRVHNAERSITLADGMHYFDITSSPLTDESGTVIAGIEAVRDITARKQSEINLARSEQRYRSLFDNVLNGFALHEIVTDEAGKPIDYKFLEANKAFEVMTGLKADLIIGKKVTDVLPGIEATSFIDIYGKVALTAVPIHFEQFAPAPLNKHFEITAFSPAPRQFVTIFSDITSRKQAESAQRDSEQRYKRLVESVTDYIYTVEVDNGRAVATYHGPGCVTVTGYTTEEYRSDPDLWYRMVFEEDKKFVVEQAHKLLSGTPIAPFEHRIIHKNGSLHWVRNTSVLRFNNAGKVISYDGMISDITQLKVLENQLRQSQKMEAIGQLAGGIAHDFNNILTAIIGYANLLLMKLPKNEPMRPYAEQIIASSERAAHLTHSLLAFSRKQLIDLKPVGINTIITRVEKILTRVIGEDIEFKTAFAEADLPVLADSIQIEQIFMNLATNARDAMPEGGTLLIETAPVELGEEYIRGHSYGKPGRYARITVTDTGIGMDENTVSRVFEPFFTTKEVGKGTGLGLSMVYGIVKQHNGYINVTSEVGKGTSFTLYFPLITSTMEAIQPTEPPVIARGTETILLAEDDTAVRNLTTNVLEDYGYRVIKAVDGEDAVRKFNERKDDIDLLVFDIIMPKKNGKEAYQEIRAVKPDIKALFTSGYTADVVHKKGILETGMEFILKPITPRDFLTKVRDVLEKK